MKRITRIYVFPTKLHARTLSFQLLSSDLCYLFVPNVPICYLFPTHLDPSLLHDALQTTLNRFPIMAGRLRTKVNEHGETRYHIDLEDSEGVLFEVFESKHPPPESGDQGTSSWRKFLVDGLYDLTFHPPFKTEPMLRVKLTLLESGQTVLCVSFVHCVTDGDALVHFMNTWSYFCGLHLGNKEKHPPEEPALPILNRVMEYDEEKLQQAEEDRLRNKGEDDEGPMSTSKLIELLVRQVPSNWTDGFQDFVLHLSDAKAYKSRVMEILPKGEWVSTYEVLCAMLFRAQAMCDDGLEPEHAKDFIARCLVNTRERGTLLPKHYFGNALTFIKFTIPREKLVAEDWLGQVSSLVHHELRSALADPDRIDHIHYVYEEGVRHYHKAGFFEELRWTKPFAQNFFRNFTFCNSWLGYNWTGVDFGSTNTPTLIWVPKTFSFRRQLFVCPRTEDTALVRVQLPAKQVKSFMKAVERLGLPFEPLEP